MFKPLYWYHGNVKFPDTEVEKMISELIRLSGHLRSLMEESRWEVWEETAISSYYLDYRDRPDKVWQPRYNEIVEEITKSIGIQSSTRYEWDYWTQLYFANDFHGAHRHYQGPSTISFVHILSLIHI